MAGPVPSEVKEVVAFVYVKVGDKLIPNGTGFFVGMPSKDAADKWFIYLVTARHVISSEPFGPILSSILLRLDKKDGGVQSIELPLISTGEHRNVFFHGDENVDIAVIPLAPDQGLFRYKFLPIELVASKDKFQSLHIAEGSEVFFTGLFTPHIGEKKNYPVVRFGRVALVTEEKVNWNGRGMNLYLVESSSFGGNSGAPVFFYLGSDRMPGSIIVGPPELFLAGIMMGAFQNISPVQIAQTSAVPVSTSNLGIAAVVPAYHLLEILESEALQRQRGN